jgi:hypothetical protein
MVVTAMQPRFYGVLQNEANLDTSHVTDNYKAGIRVVSLSIAWDRYQPQEGIFDSTYINQVKQKMQTFQSAGMQLVLDLGVVYPPPWVFNYPDSRFVNQYGDVFFAMAPGENGLNGVFNQTIRDKIEIYMRRVFQDLGTNFLAVRLGMGTVNEVNFPPPIYNNHTNSYWAFDSVAQGKVSGLPPGMTPNPVPGWLPGQPSNKHEAASQFINWYLDSLQNFHNWQITTIKKYYNGKLNMLYGGWGIRPGQIDAAIQVDLNGSTPSEQNGDIPKGTDYARFVSSIMDSNVVVYTTWLESPYGDDDSPDQAQWSPVHYLSYSANQNPLRLAVWGESAGNNSLADMQRSFGQMQKYGLIGIVWAFEAQLYDGQHASEAQAYDRQYASVDDYAALITQQSLRNMKLFAPLVVGKTQRDEPSFKE